MVKNNLDLFKDRYRQYLQVLNRSDDTLRQRINQLNKFIQFLNELGVFDIYEIKKEHISMYQKQLYYYLNQKGRQNTAQVQNNGLQAVKSFTIFLKNEGYLTYNPAKDIQYAKIPQSLPKTILNQKEMVKLLDQPNSHNIFGFRDRAILELLYSTGIRRAELLNLKPGDIDYEKGYVRINKGKGRKDRVVPLGKTAAKYLENYSKFIRPDLLRLIDCEYLFLSLRGRQLSAPQLAWLITKYSKKARLNKTVTPHTFRHTCATHLVQAKANIRCVQEILGHASLDTTQRYIQVSLVDLKETHQLCHPRERDSG
jgi:integrase/recombinase XerD